MVMKMETFFPAWPIKIPDDFKAEDTEKFSLVATNSFFFIISNRKK